MWYIEEVQWSLCGILSSITPSSLRILFYLVFQYFLCLHTCSTQLHLLLSAVSDQLKWPTQSISLQIYTSYIPWYVCLHSLWQTVVHLVNQYCSENCIHRCHNDGWEYRVIPMRGFLLFRAINNTIFVVKEKGALKENNQVDQKEIISSISPHTVKKHNCILHSSKTHKVCDNNKLIGELIN